MDENQTQPKRNCSRFKSLLYYACCCCVIVKPLKFCCCGRNKCQFKKCNDKYGFVIFCILYTVALWIWIDVIRQNGFAGIEYVASGNLEMQIRQLSGTSVNLSLFYGQISNQLSTLYADLSTSLSAIGLSVGISIIISQLYVFLLSLSAFRKFLRSMAFMQVAISGGAASTLLAVQAKDIKVGNKIVYAQYTFAVLTACVTLATVMYSVCIKKFGDDLIEKANAIMDRAAVTTNKYKCIIFIPLLFMILVIGWWILFTYLFFTINTVYSMAKPDITLPGYDSIISYHMFDNYRLWYHIFMGLFVLNSIYVFSCLIIARIICITSSLPAGSEGDAAHADDISIELKVTQTKRDKTKHIVNTNDDGSQPKRYHSKKCLYPILYALQEILSRFVGSIGIQSIIFIYVPYLRKVEKVLRIFGKLVTNCGQKLNLGKCKESDKCTEKCKICRKCCCNSCCLGVVENMLLCRCTVRGMGCCCTNISKCVKNCCVSELVSVNTMSVQGLLSKNMITSYKISEHMRSDETDLEDAIDQLVDWALYVSEIWIPFFTCALCLTLIQFNVFNIKNKLNSSVMPAFLSLAIGIIIGNLYMAVFRFATHMIFMEKMNLKRMADLEMKMQNKKKCC